MNPLGESGRTININRCKNIILRPKEEWAVIDHDSISISGIFSSHVVPLAAIPPLAGLIGSLAFGYTMMGITYRPSIGTAIATAVVQYLLGVAMIYVTALVIEFLAPHFGAIADRTKAVKLAAYSATAGWLAGIFNLIPALSFLSLLGLYGLYLLYTGLPILMRVPPEKLLVYFLSIFGVAAVMGIILSAVTMGL